ncbi:DNA polymerase III subunit alpha [Arachidicoccus terrestris]|uniref:DNA polymerase III subunit alpha n=1 Tax=Arachidicoccus terrestris TaxID=2875539 RepID=UPI001CC826F9|nr:DNA polymerase III subunit alpha [Arachidicoccus terrestris]UAY55420.1 DNA polymerase III subunit alpha [Arachidicoccus terrestris]
MLLNVHSYYSLRYGTLSLEQIVEDMMALGYENAVLTDINNSSAVLDFIRLTRDKGLNGIAGMEYRNGNELLYIGIARNLAGFKQLNELMTGANREKKALPAVAPELPDAFVIYPYGKRAVPLLKENEFIGIRPGELSKIRMEPVSNYSKYVCLSAVSFHKEDYRLHLQLRAIDHNILISQLQKEQAGCRDEAMIPKEQLLQAYSDFPRLTDNTRQLIRSCSFNFDFDEVKNKKTFTGNRSDDKRLLHKYAMDGFYRRYGKDDKTAFDRVQKELDIIDNLNFSAYFLITDDICRYARTRNYHYVGRGSGANSIIAYCLGITDVDPIALNLYFERFLNPKRKIPPDFDVDFSWNNRDDIYDYIMHRYQAGHVALMGATSTFRSRSSIRELGKVYGLPKAEIDRLIHEPEHTANKNEVTDMILSVYQQMADFPNQRTIHASGVLISERPMTSYCALDYPPKGLPTAQFDMYVAEQIGFEKFDILSQRGIGHIKDCKELIRQNLGEIVSTDNPRRFFSDEKMAAQLRSANTIGCFYIESPAMLQLLTKLRCDNYPTLVAASSIIRPGVAASGMMKAYIERHLDPDKAVYPHRVFKEQLQDTYGVMVYQEDVMKIGHHYGGLDLADADVLRRMMSGKTRNTEQLDAIRDKFFDHCLRAGYPDTTSKEIWRQMESFAGYSFNKAHSASFAVESYQSLFLKTYYPREFMVAVLNNYGGFYQRKVYVNEARKAGGVIGLPCVNRSVLGASISGKDIYLGFDSILNLEGDLSARIAEQWLRGGDYTSLENFALRTGAGLEQLIILIRSGAFRHMGTGKKELLWEAHLLLSSYKPQRQASLFENTAKKPVLPKLETSLLEDLYDEIELLGFPVSGSMFDLLKSDYRGTASGKDLTGLEGLTVRVVGDFVCDKQVRTKTGAVMKFGTFLDVNGDFIDTIHFPAQLKQFPLQGNGVYLIQGKVVKDFGCAAIEVEKCARMPLKPDPRSI